MSEWVGEWMSIGEWMDGYIQYMPTCVCAHECMHECVYIHLL